MTNKPQDRAEGKMSHKELVEKAKQWLIQAKGCNPVFTEKGSQRISEMPDAIGWNGHNCYVVEAKVSMADFNADKKKPHRTDGGMGNLRYFLVPKEIENEAMKKLPIGWGLLSIRMNEFVSQIRLMGSNEHTRNLKAEVFYLRSRILEIQRYGA